MTANLSTFDLMSQALLTLGWIINYGIFQLFAQTGLLFVPFIALIVREWYKARNEGDEAGTKGVLTVNRIETALYSMLLVYVFTVHPVFQIGFNPVNLDEDRASECGYVTLASSGSWDDHTLSGIDGASARMPIWWAFVHMMSQGVTNAAIASIPCKPDFHAVRSTLDLNSITDPILQRDIGAFHQRCYGGARSLLFERQGSLDTSRSVDVDWLGSRYFLTTPGYYDSLYAPRPIEGFPYNETRDATRQNTGPGLPGYPTCAEWWLADNVGLRARMVDQIKPEALDYGRSLFSSLDFEDFAIRRMISNRTGNAHGNVNYAFVGYRNLDQGNILTDGSQFRQLANNAAGALGMTLGAWPAAAGMDIVKQALPMVHSILIMCVIICLPFVLLLSGYSMKVAGVATFGLFSIWFLKFWWELARWLNSHMVDLIYRSEAAKLSWMAGVNNAYDRGVMMFVEWSMFLIFPAIWIGVLGWAGMSVGNAVHNSLSNSTAPAQKSGSQGAGTVQGAATRKMGGK